jgi:carboxymethylenebutenolidase
VTSGNVTIDVEGTPMTAYVARPDRGRHPAAIVLEGVYGFDDELRRITDLLASTGYVGIAIDYFHRTDPDLREPFTEEGRRHGTEATKAVTKAGLRADVAAARDWLNAQPFVEYGRVATWGFGFGGTAAFVTASLPGLVGAVAFYGQSVTSAMPSGEGAPLEDVAAIRAPLLLVFGGRDALIAESDIEATVRTLNVHGKTHDVQIYPNVGHSFFRTSGESIAAREAADAWDRVQAFLQRTTAGAVRR